MKKETDVLVIGGGPAGLLAAIRAAGIGAKVILAEKNTVLGKKLRITGKGRCNITNTGEMQAFIRQYGGQGKFLHSAFARFFSGDIRSLLAQAGVETKEERGGRVFPQSDRAQDVAEALERLAVKAGVEILTGCKVQSLIVTPVGGASVSSYASRIEGARVYDAWDQSEILAGAVILATGGMSYPLTGSTGDGYTWAKDAGHTIVPLKPALAPLLSNDSWVSELSGLTLKNVKASLWEYLPDAVKPRRLAAFQGEMLFAHFGLTGPIILSLSRYYEEEAQHSFEVRIDLKPALSPEILDKRLQRDLLKYQKKHLANAMTDLLPHALIPVVIQAAGLEENQAVALMTRTQRQSRGNTLKALPVQISGIGTIEEAIVTAGGVDLTDVQPGSMASKKTAGLYFAGELLDIDGLTGGYNLQAAFSTGWVAGESAAKKVLDGSKTDDRAL